MSNVATLIAQINALPPAERTILVNHIAHGVEPIAPVPLSVTRDDEAQVEWEYGVKWGDEPDHNPPAICDSREHAESRAAASHGDKVVRRARERTIPAGPWHEVPAD